jgi:malonyl-CoA O-methyltransferase
MQRPIPDRDEFFLDPRQVRRSFDRASHTFDANAAVHAELRNRLLERLDVVRLQPAAILDLGAGTGHATRALQDRYRSAYVVAADISTGMLAQARRQQRFLKRFGRVACDAHDVSFKAASFDLVFSNLMLQWCADPDRVFANLARVLKVGGLLTFTALGPDTLRELRTAWASAAHVHVHRFIDMHDLGDALMRAGFAEPVMDTERLTITYQTVDALFAELQGTGSTNLAHGRTRGLTSSRRQRAAKERYESIPSEGRLPVTLEVVYGHAWSSGVQARKEGGEFAIPVGRIGRRQS